MSLKAAAIQAHPEFPWIDPSKHEEIETILRDLGWLMPGEWVRRVSKAGEGNMNLTLRVETNTKSAVLKQARPWVEKYDYIAAPWDRILFEQGFYQRVQRIPEVALRMPKIYGSDAGARVLLLEDLVGARDLTDLYTGAKLAQAEVAELAAYARALHSQTRGNPDPEFENRAMRALNHEHIFNVPLRADNGLDIERFEPGLQAVADRLKQSREVCERTWATGEDYLGNGPCLLHGDYFPGSWLRTAHGIRVIDPEFCFYGEPEFDLGVAVAHFALSHQSENIVDSFLDSYALSFDAAQTSRYASIEIMRRLIGVAQLPIAPSTGFRADLLGRAEASLINDNYRLLWT